MKQANLNSGVNEVTCNLFETYFVNNSMKHVTGCELKVNEFQLEERQRLFSELVYVHYQVLKRDASYLTRNTEFAEDLVQQVLLKAWKHLDKIVAAGSTALTLLRHMVKKAWYDYYRQLKKQPVALSQFDEETSEYLSEKILFDTPCENYNFLHEEINKLSNCYKDVIYLFYFKGLKIKEISEKLGVAEGTVKANLNRAKKILKSKLEGVL